MHLPTILRQIPPRKHYRSIEIISTPGYTKQPYSLITAYTVVGDTQEQAEHLALSQLKNSLRIRQNLPLQLLDTREESKEFLPEEQALITDIRQKWIIADAEKAAHKIRSLATELKLDEIMLVPTSAASQKDDPHIHPARVHSLELLAHEMFS